ncbi:hypothetical protein [Jiangella muralis]|nr:hypothetical protein [Jiangella muralis]
MTMALLMLFWQHKWRHDHGPRGGRGASAPGEETFRRVLLHDPHLTV